MFIHVPPGIVFGGTCATPWKTLIFPILKTVLTLMFKKSWHIWQRQQEHGTEIMMWFGREGTQWMDCRLAWKDKPLSNTDDWLLQPEDEHPGLLSAWRTEGWTPPTTYRSWRQTGRWLLPQMWQKQGCGHLSWCHWCCLQGREGISEQGRRNPSGQAKNGKRMAEINLHLWKPPEVSWFCTCCSTDLP